MKNKNVEINTMSKEKKEWVKGKSEHFEKVKEPRIGWTYHLEWAYPGCKWKLLHIWDKYAIMGATQSGKILLAKVSELRHLKGNNF